MGRQTLLKSINQSKIKSPKHKQLECGPMTNVMAALPNIGGALCSLCKVWLTLNTGVPCSNAAKTRKPLKLAGVSQTTGPISAASGPKFTILWGHVEEILLLNKFFPTVDMCLNFEDMARQNCAIVPRWPIFDDFFGSCISSEPRAAHFRLAF